MNYYKYTLLAEMYSSMMHSFKASLQCCWVLTQKSFNKCLLTTHKYTWHLTSTFVIAKDSFAIYEKKFISFIGRNQQGFISSFWKHRIKMFFAVNKEHCQSLAIKPQSCFAFFCKQFLFTLIRSRGNLDYDCLLSACPRARQRFTIIVNETSGKIWHCSAQFITVSRVNTF